MPRFIGQSTQGAVLYTRRTFLIYHGRSSKRSPPYGMNWCKTYYLKTKDQWKRFNFDSPLLHIASCCGIIPWVRDLLMETTWKLRAHKLANMEDSNGFSPLHYAAREGHEA